MSLKNILLRLSTLRIYNHILGFVFALCMISMVVLSGLTALTVNAVNYSVSVYPNSILVGDTVTVSFINTGTSDNKYRVSYSLGQYGSEIYLGNWSSDSLYTFVLNSVGRYWVRCYARDEFGSTSTYQIVDVLENSEPESSEPESSEPESSEPESSEPESSEPESSFDPMNWMPSDWRGGDYIQPSAESTPDLSYDELPSDFDAFNVSENLTGILGHAFSAFPAKLIVLMVPTIICLFIGWWLHK